MKSFCKNCESLQPSSFRLEHDAETRKPYEDLCCNTCHFVVATVQWREALAQPPLPAQEPVAWAVQGCSKMWRGEFAEIDAKAEAKRIGGTCVAYVLYTAPPQRPWVGLTEKDFSAINQSCLTKLQAATSAESILKERNS
jgi:hypothetical protein